MAHFFLGLFEYLPPEIIIAALSVVVIILFSLGVLNFAIIFAAMGAMCGMAFGLNGAVVGSVIGAIFGRLLYIFFAYLEVKDSSRSKNVPGLWEFVLNSFFWGKNFRIR